MSPSPPPATVPKKRTRTFAACQECRKKKIKCVTTSNDDDEPCARCTQKGIQCYFLPILEDDSSFQSHGTPSPQGQRPHHPASHNSAWGHAGSSSGPNAAMIQPYPYGGPSHPYLLNTWTPNMMPNPQQQPSMMPPYGSNAANGFSPPRNSGYTANPQYHNAGEYPHANPSGSGANFYDPNNGQANEAYIGNVPYQWPQFMEQSAFAHPDLVFVAQMLNFD
ncbi:hypothetical protein C8R43DRAFT_1235360 [Mycena crocata]|nr:hypothetical protein C8R43DRAFT_1235360 [Mycena crocata]